MSSDQILTALVTKYLSGGFVFNNKLLGKIISGAILAIFLVSCNPQASNDGLKEKAQIESETSAKNQTKAAIEAQNKRATEMEQDLSRRHLFYQALKGRFEGSFTTELGEFQIRIILSPSLNPLATDRVRLPEEVASDLNNLHFNAQFQQWSTNRPTSAVGCRVENILPDITKGALSIVSANCTNVYFLVLSETGDGADLSARDHYKQTIDKAVGTRVSQDITSGKLNSLNELTGFIQLSNAANSYYFRAKRVEQ